MPKLAPSLSISISQQNPSWWKLGKMFLDASRHENLSMIANSCLGKVEFNSLATCKSENRWRQHFSSPPLLQKRLILQLCSFSATFFVCKFPTSISVRRPRCYYFMLHNCRVNAFDDQSTVNEFSLFILHLQKIAKIAAFMTSLPRFFLFIQYHFDDVALLNIK